MTRRRVAIVGAAAISQAGALAAGLGRTLVERRALPGVPPETPLANPKGRNARKMMSRGAYLAAAALGDLMHEVGWTDEQREAAGYFLGVGASGGSLDDVTALLDASLIGEHPAFSLQAFGEHGLAACNPLLAFQLMNNFTLAHGAILEGLGGPNGALFSRGSGTTAALIEAVHAIRAGDCDRAVAGGADSATHPVTLAELTREGFIQRGLIAAEGAAIVALAAAPVAQLEVAGCAIANGAGRGLLATVADAAERAIADASEHATLEVTRTHAASPRPRSSSGPLAIVSAILAPPETAPTAVAPSQSSPMRTMAIDLVVITAWGPPAAEPAASWARARFPTANIVETSQLGATLAAAPALGWAVAFDLLSTGFGHRALVIDAGVDGDAGAVVIVSGAAGAQRLGAVA
jgi:hypothetical protein